MTASESVPGAASLQASIEKLIAETVRRSQSDQEAEHEKLKSAMQAAASEIESAQAAMQRAVDALREGLGSLPGTAITQDFVTTEVVPTTEKVIETSQAAPEASTPEKEEITGPHRIDVIAHNVTIGIASGLQSFLRERSEVAGAQTREFVNGELRLDVEMISGLDTSALSTWVSTHQGTIVTQTGTVIELRFGGN